MLQIRLFVKKIHFRSTLSYTKPNLLCFTRIEISSSSVWTIQFDKWGGRTNNIYGIVQRPLISFSANLVCVATKIKFRSTLEPNFSWQHIGSSRHVQNHPENFFNKPDVKSHGGRSQSWRYKSGIVILRCGGLCRRGTGSFPRNEQLKK